MKKDNINALDEIHKGATMGIDAVSMILEKVKAKDLKQVLTKQLHSYQDIAKKINEIYPKYNEGKPHSTNLMNKAMTWSGIEMKTMNDDSNSKLAELLLQGVNMGIIEGRKILNKKKIDEEIEFIVSDYVTMQEKTVEILKKYL